MVTKKQREFLKQNLPNRFYIKNEYGEQVYHYYTNNCGGGYFRLGEVNQVIEQIKNNTLYIPL